MNYSHLLNRTNIQACTNGKLNLRLKTERECLEGQSVVPVSQAASEQKGRPTYPRAVAAKAAPAAPTSSQSR